MTDEMEIPEPSDEEEAAAAADLAELTRLINAAHATIYGRDDDEQPDGFGITALDTAMELALDFQIRGDRNLGNAFFDADHEALALFATWLVRELENWGAGGGEREIGVADVERGQ